MYQVKTRYGWRDAPLQQKSSGTGNRWVSIGVFDFAGRPQVRLNTAASDGDGTQRVAFDAVAFEPVTSPQCLTARIIVATKDTKICSTHLAPEQDSRNPRWADAQVQTGSWPRFG